MLRRVLESVLRKEIGKQRMLKDLIMECEKDERLKSIASWVKISQIYGNVGAHDDGISKLDSDDCKTIHKQLVKILTYLHNNKNQP